MNYYWILQGMFEFELSDKVKCFVLIFNTGTQNKQKRVFVFVFNRLTWGVLVGRGVAYNSRVIYLLTFTCISLLFLKTFCQKNFPYWSLFGKTSGVTRKSFLIVYSVRVVSPRRIHKLFYLTGMVTKSQSPPSDACSVLSGSLWERSCCQCSLLWLQMLWIQLLMAQYAKILMVKRWVSQLKSQQ